MLPTKKRRSGANTVAEWYATTGAHLDETVVVDVLEALRVQGWLDDSRPGLTEAEITYLEQHGGVRDNREALIESRIAGAVLEETVEKESMTVTQAADLMGISASRVRHRIREGSLYAYPSSGRGVERQIPYWQFHDRKPTPHLSAVLNALPERFRPSDIRAFALHAEIDDPVNGVTVPLLDWLRDGGDPQVARELAESTARLI